MNPWLLLTVLVLIALAAPRYGVDSRRLPPGELPPPRRGPTPRSDLAALVRWARAPIRRGHLAAVRPTPRSRAVG